MKVQKSKTLSAFGGINFVFELLDTHSIDKILDKHLPSMASQSKYSWKDILYSLLSIYLCGGEAIEDLQTNLKSHFRSNPFVNMPSPDTLLRRFKELSTNNNTCHTKRGVVEHTYNTNYRIEQLNVDLLKKMNVFDQEELTLDYDNTIIFNEKSDSRMTYKRNPGYQPGVCTINEQHILYIENRNGNSDAKSFQLDTLKRMFEMLSRNNIRKLDHFRADAASYQFDVVDLVEKHVKDFFIGCRNSYVEKYFAQIEEWEKIDEEQEMEVGEITITPFVPQANLNNKKPKPYRLIVKRKLKKTNQLDIFTNDSFEYRAILTNNTTMTAVEVAQFYNHRGNMERQFDILKNDFGWNNMPFSLLNQNTVFLYFTAICRNLFNTTINYFGKKVKGINPTVRVKKFLFRFIILPSKWIKRSRQIHLRIYGDIPLIT